MHRVPRVHRQTGALVRPGHQARRAQAGVWLVVMGMLQSACTVIHVHGDSQVTTRVLPGIAVVNIAAQPGAASYAHIRAFGLSVQQQGFVLGLVNVETIHADPQKACFSLVLKQADELFEPSTFSCQSSRTEKP